MKHGFGMAIEPELPLASSQALIRGSSVFDPWPTRFWNGLPLIQRSNKKGLERGIVRGLGGDRHEDGTPVTGSWPADFVYQFCSPLMSLVPQTSSQLPLRSQSSVSSV